jgi:CBS domain-containing protein
LVREIRAYTRPRCGTPREELLTHMLFDKPVCEYMTSPVVSVRSDASLSTVARLLEDHRISALPVVDQSGALISVLSRTDLVRVGRLQAGANRKAPVLTLPDRKASELAAENTRTPLTVKPSTTLREAARLMVENHVHRLFVMEGTSLAGVISTYDMMTAVSQARIELPIAEIMSKPLFTVRANEPLGVAVERLNNAHITGLVVVDDDFPVGVFTQIEAMQARDLPRDTRVDEVFDPSMLCLPLSTKLFRAAEQARRLEVRRIIPCQDRDAVGIVTSFDFAKLIANS